MLSNFRFFMFNIGEKIRKDWLKLRSMNILEVRRYERKELIIFIIAIIVALLVVFLKSGSLVEAVKSFSIWLVAMVLVFLVAATIWRLTSGGWRFSSDKNLGEMSVEDIEQIKRNENRMYGDIVEVLGKILPIILIITCKVLPDC